MHPHKSQHIIPIYTPYNHHIHHSLLTQYQTLYHTLHPLKKPRFTLPILTTKLTHTLNIPLNLTPIRQFFQTVLTLHDLTNPNPHPHPLLLA
ncbi:HAD hydrolase-like protein, partial [Bacillus subtilis]|uniref:HAD hydrolase-like protein n=1 Tax=Bacillus subtilis TaxID=1423 RepID=UPI00338DA45F